MVADHLGTTLFSFASRHHTVQSNATSTSFYHASFDPPTGLHPTLSLTLSRADVLAPPHPSCTLNAYLTLPSTLFIDKHQFTDQLFLSSHNIVALRSLAGAADLEAPEYAVPQWGSAALFELVAPHSSRTRPGEEWQVSVPLHLRYLTPTPGGYTNLTFPYPVVFWACSTNEDVDFGQNPFDRKNLGFDGLFGHSTMFYHLEPAPAPTMVGLELEPLTMSIKVPALDLNQSTYVEAGTISVVLVGFLWICWKLFGPLSLGGQPQKQRSELGKKRQ